MICEINDLIKVSTATGQYWSKLTLQSVVNSFTLSYNEITFISLTLKSLGTYPGQKE